jgi:hypothetical protein
MQRIAVVGAALALVAGALVHAADPPPAAPAGAETAEALVGSWRLLYAGTSMTITFEADGTYRAIAPNQVLLGRWELVDETRIATWSNPEQPKRVSGFTLDGDSLVIVDQRGRFHKHRRIRDAAGGGRQ